MEGGSLVGPKPWVGKHVWIWMLSQVGPPEHIVRRAVDMKLSGLLVKAWDGGTSGLFLDQLKQMLDPAHDSGLLVGAWGYSYGNNISGEVKAMQKALKAGADWLVIDAEDEYESREGAKRALSLGLELTQNLGAKVPLGYTTFALSQYHDSFPYAEFSSFCSVCLPQIYWGLMDFPLDEVFAMALRGLAKHKLPVAPIGQCYGEVTPGEIIRFSELARINDLPGISYYSWQHASENQLTAVGKAAYAKDSLSQGWVGFSRDETDSFSDPQSDEGIESPKKHLTVLQRFLSHFKKDTKCELE